MIHLIERNLTDIPEELGIYKVFAVSENGHPVPIQRFAGVDPSGILYIGQTTKQTLKKRIYNLLATTRATGKTTNHSGGLKYKTNPIIRQTLVNHMLYVDFEICEFPLKREKVLLQEYSSIFGEYPPLNK